MNSVNNNVTLNNNAKKIQNVTDTYTKKAVTLKE